MSASSGALANDDLRRAIRVAAEWYACLRSGTASKAERRRWADWVAASDVNRRAWNEIEAVEAQMAGVPGRIAAPTLLKAELSRRELLSGLGILAFVAPVGWLGFRAMPWDEWRADYRTAVGERRKLVLADGSSLALDTASAVDVAFTERQRLVRLHAGEILITTAPDAASTPRPFVVATEHGTVEALGTRFSVRAEAGRTRVTVLEHAVRITPAGATARTVELAAGQRLSFDAHRAGPSEPAPVSAGSWVDGSLVVVDMPLGKLIDELGRYRPGVLSCDPAIVGIEVSGAFPLADTDRALSVLAEAFPVRQRRLTRYWVKIVPA